MKKITQSLTIKSFASLFILTLFSTFASAQETGQLESGFYMNEGCTKVDVITCYGYEDFGYVHKITDVMLAYDKIQYEFSIVNMKTGFIEGKTIRSIEGKIFNSAVKGQSMVRIPIRVLEYTRTKKSLENTYYSVEMYGFTISGYEEKYDDYSKTYRRTPTYHKKNLISNQIELKNRKFLQPKTTEYIPIITAFVKEKPMPEIEKSPDCYPCVGEKPRIFEFKPSNY